VGDGVVVAVVMVVVVNTVVVCVGGATVVVVSVVVLVYADVFRVVVVSVHVAEVEGVGEVVGSVTLNRVVERVVGWSSVTSPLHAATHRAADAIAVNAVPRP
jgi:hypothetical protein